MVETESAPCCCGPVSQRSQLKCSANLGEEDLLGSQLPQHGLQLGTANVVGERAEVELRSRTVQHANPERVPFIFLATLTDRNTVTRLIVREELFVDESPVGVYLVQLPELLVRDFER